MPSHRPIRAYADSLARVVGEQLESCRLLALGKSSRTSLPVQNVGTAICDSLPDRVAAFALAGQIDQLVAIRNGLTHLESILRAAVNAKRDLVPSGLLNYAEGSLRQICGREVQIALQETEHPSHYYRPTDLRELAVDLYAAQQEWPEVALIGVPTGCAGRLLRNLFVLHEAGHHVHEITRLVDHALAAVRASRLGMGEFTILESLLVEVFSDLVAVHLCGPAYVFAFLDYTPPQVGFSETHPPKQLRARTQALYLEARLAWPAGGVLTRLAERTDALQMENASTADSNLSSKTIERFHEAMPLLIDLTHETLPVSPAYFRTQLRDDLNALLNEVMGGREWPAPAAKLILPSRRTPVAVMNAASQAISSFADLQREEPGIRWTALEWTRTVEQWAIQRLNRARLGGSGSGWPSEAAL